MRLSLEKEMVLPFVSLRGAYETMPPASGWVLPPSPPSPRQRSTPDFAVHCAEHSSHQGLRAILFERGPRDPLHRFLPNLG